MLMSAPKSGISINIIEISVSVLTCLWEQQHFKIHWIIVDTICQCRKYKKLKKKENAYNRQQQAQQEEHSMNETVELCVSADSADYTETGDSV